MSRWSSSIRVAESSIRKPFNAVRQCFSQPTRWTKTDLGSPRRAEEKGSQLAEKEKSLVFPRIWEDKAFPSDADGTRTRNLRIDRPPSDSTFTRQKPCSNEIADFWVSNWASQFCNSEIREWLDSCPVQLDVWQLKGIATLTQHSLIPAIT